MHGNEMYYLNREALGIAQDAPVESFLPRLVEGAKTERLAYVRMRRLLETGNLLQSPPSVRVRVGGKAVPIPG